MIVIRGLLPEQRLALAALNRALKDAHMTQDASLAADAERFLAVPSYVLRLFCDICSEEMTVLNQECRDHRLPDRLPRRRADNKKPALERRLSERSKS